MRKILIETTLLLSVLVSGLLMVQYHQQSQIGKIKLDQLITVQKVTAKLLIETMFIGRNNSEHYDKHAQLQLNLEHNLDSMTKQTKIVSLVLSFNANIEAYIQIVTMLNTSNRLLASSQLYFNNSSLSLKHAGNHLLALLLKYNNKPTRHNNLEIKSFIDKNTSLLQQLNQNGMQWHMLNQHIRYILINTSVANNLIDKLKNSKLEENLQMAIKHQTSELLIQKNSKNTCVIFIIFMMFGLILRILLLQRKR